MKRNVRKTSGKIIPLDALGPLLKQEKEKKASVVLTGGCFDILHIGHIRFLQFAKKKGDTLIVLLEHDETVRKLKGKNRPVFSQSHRSEVLQALQCVDRIIPLPPLPSDTLYRNLVSRIQPYMIAVTRNDPNRDKKYRQAQRIGAKIATFTHVKNVSSSKIARILEIDE